MLLAMALMLVASTLWKKYFLSTNPASRIITVERLLEAGTFAHATPNDTTPFGLSIDCIKVGSNLYSSKPPNYPLLMTAESWVFKKLTGWSFYPHRRDYVRMLTLVNQVIPMLLMLYLAFLFLRNFTHDSWTLYFMITAMGLGSLTFAYTPTINNHSLAACIFFMTWYWVYQVTAVRKAGIWEYFTIGFCVGLAVTIELPGAAYATSLLGLLFLHDWRKSCWALAGSLLPLVPTMIVYKVISGTWKPFYFQGGLYRYEGSYWQNPQGLDAVHPNKWVYIFNLLLGYKGLFFMTPLLALGLVGWVGILKKDANSKMWLHARVLLLASVAILGFVWLRTHNYGGDCIGQRWLLVTMPFMMFLAWPVVERLGKNMWGRIFCISLLILGLPGVFEAMVHDAFILGPWQEAWGSLLG